MVILQKSGICMDWFHKQTPQSSLQQTHALDQHTVHPFIMMVIVVMMIGERLQSMEQRKLTDILESKAKFLQDLEVTELT